MNLPIKMIYKYIYIYVTQNYSKRTFGGFGSDMGL